MYILLCLTGIAETKGDMAKDDHEHFTSSIDINQLNAAVISFMLDLFNTILYVYIRVCYFDLDT